MIALLGGIIGPKTADGIGRAVLIVACIVAAFFLGRCDGARDERARHVAATANANEKAVTRDAVAKEQAAAERAADIATIEAKKKGQVDAIQGDDDAAVRRNAACKRLRDARGNQAALSAGCRPEG